MWVLRLYEEQQRSGRLEPASIRPPNRTQVTYDPAERIKTESVGGKKLDRYNLPLLRTGCAPIDAVQSVS